MLSEDITQVVSELEPLFRRESRSLLGRYIGKDLKSNRDEELGGVTSDNQRLRRHANIFAIINTPARCPSIFLRILSNVGKANADDLENQYVEYRMSTMNPTAMIRSAKPVPRREQLFLAWLRISGSKKNFRCKHREALRILEH